MERKIFQLTAQQMKKVRQPVPMPTDEEFQAQWKKAHHGKVTGWGMAKRDWALKALRGTAEYQQGLWQGRADRARGIGYSEERNDSSYNLGYHDGYTGYESDRHGWDPATRQRFDEQYLID